MAPSPKLDPKQRERTEPGGSNKEKFQQLTPNAAQGPQCQNRAQKALGVVSTLVDSGSLLLHDTGTTGNCLITDESRAWAPFQWF